MYPLPPRHDCLPTHQRCYVGLCRGLDVVGRRVDGRDRSTAQRDRVPRDDQGSADVGCYGAKDLETPAMDGLAARGVRFTQFYAAAPVCSPSRAGLLTGRYPLRAGLTGNASSQPGGKAAMPAAQITLAEMFKAGWLRHRPHRQVASRLHAGHDAERAGLRLLLRPHGRLHRQLLPLLLLGGPEPPRPRTATARRFTTRAASSPT